jgi:hypothetical protein
VYEPGARESTILVELKRTVAPPLAVVADWVSTLSQGPSEVVSTVKGYTTVEPPRSLILISM